MSLTMPTPNRSWTRAHRAALTIVLLGIALAASVGLLAAHLAGGWSVAPATSVSGGLLHPTDNGCQNALPGEPC